MTLTIGSLFSGIGGFELGLERAGLGPVLWQVESDRFCRSVLAKHWPQAERFEDVRTIGAAEPQQPGEALADSDRRRRGTKRSGGVFDRERQTRGNDAHGCDLSTWPPAPDDMHAWRQVSAEAQPAVCRVAHRVPRGVDRRRLRALGNAVVPQVAEIIGRAIMETAA